MNDFSSSLYECRVFHRRYVRSDLRFVRRIFLFCVDLDELPELHRRLRWFGYNRRNLFSFYDRDHFVWQKEPVAPEETTKERVVRYLREHGADFTPGRIMLATNLRVFGYVFNPVSFYYCYDAAGRLRAVLSEVNNTYGEQKPFLSWVNPDEAERMEAGGDLERRAVKNFYVSPFIRDNTDFYFKFQEPGELLRVRIDSFLKRHTILKAQIHGRRRPLNDGSLLRMALRYPLITVKIIAWIHMYALKLYLRKLLVFDKKESDERVAAYNETEGVVCETELPQEREYPTRVRKKGVRAGRAGEKERKLARL